MAPLDHKTQDKDVKTPINKRPSRRVVKMDLEGNVLETYDSVNVAARQNGVKVSTLYAAVQPHNKTTVLQCLWSYEDDVA